MIDQSEIVWYVLCLLPLFQSQLTVNSAAGFCRWQKCDDSTFPIMDYLIVFWSQTDNLCAASYVVTSSHIPRPLSITICDHQQLVLRIDAVRVQLHQSLDWKQRWQLVFESPVLGLAKDCNWTELRPNKTKTEKNCLLVFCSLGLGLFILEKSKRLKKTGLNWSFLGPIMYISTTILGLFLAILSYFFGIYSWRFSLTGEYSTCHPEMWISLSFLGWTTWSNALNVDKGRYHNPLHHH